MSKHLRPDGLFTYDSLVHAVAGAAGSMTAMTVFFPFDTIRSRLQVEDARKSKNTFVMMMELVKEEGLSSLYRGLNPVLLSLFCSGFVYFYAFHGIRASALKNGSPHTPGRDLMIGIVAGIANVLLTTPLWVVNLRMKMQGAKLADDDKVEKYPHYKGVLDALYKICKTEGVQGLWSGTVPSLLLVTNPAINFMVYEALKRRVQARLKARDIDSLTVFMMGAISKSISTILTYPLQIAQSKLRYGPKEMKALNILQIFILLIRKHGVQGLYKGLEAKLWQTVLTSALMLLCYEKIVAFVFYIMKGSRVAK